jgi:hypothetical protein
MIGSAAEVTNAYRSSVHAREEQEIGRRFGESGRAWANKEEMLRLDSVEVRSARDGAQRSLLEAGEEAVLAVSILGKDAAQPIGLRIWVERNDGIVLFDETARLGPGSPSSTARDVELDLGRLTWRPFIYQIHVEILSAKGPVAHNAVTVKIWSDIKVSGGTPMLRDPVLIRARRV